nr:MAG TPA: hypothetical protein [Caudoviricetes sp.]
MHMNSAILIIANYEHEKNAKECGFSYIPGVFILSRL